jgi:hypothetical protein
VPYCGLVFPVVGGELIRAVGLSFLWTCMRCGLVCAGNMRVVWTWMCCKHMCDVDLWSAVTFCACCRLVHFVSIYMLGIMKAGRSVELEYCARCTELYALQAFQVTPLFTGSHRKL